MLAVCRTGFLLWPLLLMLAGPGVRAENYRFDIHANGFHYGEFDVLITETPGAYKVGVVAEAKGIFGFVIRARYKGEALGDIVSTDWVSTYFKARSSRIFVDRTSEVRFEAGRPVFVRIAPEKRKTELSSPLAVKVAVQDPLSLLANLILYSGPDCPKSQLLYDGRRITRVAFKPRQKAAKSFTCHGFYEIIEGPDHSLQKGERRFALKLEYQQSSDGSASLEAIRITSGSNEIAFTKVAE